MGKRAGSFGEGTWAIPGGHLEFGESFAETAAREVLEETGLRIKNIRFGAVTNDYFEDEEKQYVTIWILSEYDSGEAMILEPTKCSEQKWFDFATMPTPLFSSWNQLFESEFIEGVKEALTRSI